jgi:hypothetical protein
MVVRLYLSLAVVLAACGDTPSSMPSSDAPEVVVDAAVPPDALDERVEDPCPATTACPMPPSITRGAGLVAIDRCAFPLAPTTTDYAGTIAALSLQLDRVTMADVVADANRTADVVAAGQVPGNAPGVKAAFRWNSGDEAVTYWTPQGITGSFDGTATGKVGDRKVVLVSWYYNKDADAGSTVEKGVRIAVVDVTNPADVKYRFALLVEPTGSATAPSYKSVPIHAGGLAWVGDRLYVPQTGTGFRVFDLAHILKVDSLDDRIGYDAASGTFAAHGYQYVIPQVERISSTNACASVFSFVAYDRTSTPPSLVSGEYDAASIRGRLYRWPLTESGALQLTKMDRVLPSAAYFMGESHVQGALVRGDRWWLSSSRPAGSAGELVRTKEAASSVRLGWNDSPEDLAYDPQRDSVWSLSEGLNARYVFDVARASISP